MIAQAEDTLVLLLIAAIGLLITVRLYRAVGEQEDAELETLETVPLRIVTEEDFDVAFKSMDEDRRLAAQRRAEALNWFDEDEHEKKSA